MKLIMTASTAVVMTWQKTIIRSGRISLSK